MQANLCLALCWSVLALLQFLEGLVQRIRFGEKRDYLRWKPVISGYRR